jgi:hypothetical protein
LQVGLQITAVGFFEVVEFERLETTLGRPHGKQHGSLAAYGVVPDVKYHFYLDSFIQRPLEVEQSAGKGKLVQARPNFPSAVQPDQSQNGTCEFDPGGASGLVISSWSGHDFRPTMPLPGPGVEITKELDLLGSGFALCSPPGLRRARAAAPAQKEDCGHCSEGRKIVLFG